MPPPAPRLVARVSREANSLLQRLPLFAGLSAAKLAELANELTWTHLPAGRQLFAQGEDADALYVVAYGRLAALVENRTVGYVTRGEVVGETALLTGEPRTATVRAVRDSMLIRLSKSSFDSVLLHDAPALMSLTRLLIERIRRSQDLRHRTARPAVISLHGIGRNLDVRQFAAQLTAALESLGRLECVSAREAAGILGRNPDWEKLSAREEEVLTAWLSEKEDRTDLLLFVSDDASPREWRSRCLRVADMLFLLADGDQPPPTDLGDLEARETDAEVPEGVRRELLLFHAPSRGLGNETARWLDRIKPAAHHHLHFGSVRDVERLARLTTGSSITLVLGGGGARGFAHIGVYRALVEAGLPVDVVGGTSSGALIAGQIALGWDAATIQAATKEIFATGRLFDPTIPAVSLFKGAHAATKLRKRLGDVNIEDLWKRFFCVSSNLTTATTVIHERGPLWKWIMCSGTIPGIGPPVVHEGDLLVDGGILDNFPIETGRRIGQGRVVASNVVTSVDRSSFGAYPAHLTPVQLFWRRFRPWAPDRTIPTLPEILSRATSLASARQIEDYREEVELFFEPPVAEYGTFDLKQIDAIVEAGYRHAVSKLAPER